MLTFALACVLLFITPGPGVLTLAGVGSAFGYRAGLSYGVGLFLGTNFVAVAVVTGAAAVFLADPMVRQIAFWLSVSYLLYLAARIAFAGSWIGFIGAQKAPGVAGGLALQAINPKAYVVNTTLFLGFPIWPGTLYAEVALKFLIINVVWVSIHLLWLAAGVSIHRLELAPRTQFAINVAMALAMLGVVGLAAMKEF